MHPAPASIASARALSPLPREPRAHLGDVARQPGADVRQVPPEVAVIGQPRRDFHGGSETSRGPDVQAWTTTAGRIARLAPSEPS